MVILVISRRSSQSNLVKGAAMNLNIFEKKSSNLFAENKLLKLGVVAMVIFSLLNHLTLRKAMNTSRTILVPANMNKQVELYGNTASDEYVRMFIELACTRAFSYTPGNVTTQFALLLTMFSPEVYPQTKLLLSDLATTVFNTRLSTAFYIQRMDINSSKSTVEVLGQQLRWMENSTIENESKKYVFSYRISDGHFWITALSEEGVKDGDGDKIEIESVKPSVTPQTQAATGGGQ